MGLFNAFFFLIQAGTKKIDRLKQGVFFLGGGGGLGWVSSCVLMVNLKAATT